MDLNNLLDKTIDTSDINSLNNVAKSIAQYIQPGDIFFLNGNLGAGKTTFVRLILNHLGWHNEVKSPTFSIIQLYPDVTPPILHADLYRVNNATNLDIEEYFDTYVSFIEWPDVLQGVNSSRVFNCLLNVEENNRSITIRKIT